MACGLLAYLPHISHQLSEEDRHLVMFAVLMTGVPALCIFMGTLAGYIAMGFLVQARNAMRRQDAGCSRLPCKQLLVRIVGLITER
jgi:hypothetical protein